MQKRSSIIVGVIMILAGALFLLVNLFPSLAAQLNMSQQWPLLVVGVGALFLLSALLGSPPLAIPGSIITGIGGILYYQNLTGNWASWAFTWTLIPGFVGIGVILNNLLSGQGRRAFREGGSLILISALLFIIFAAFFNGLGNIGQYWPIVLILLGLWLLLQNRISQRR